MLKMTRLAALAAVLLIAAAGAVVAAGGAGASPARRARRSRGARRRRRRPRRRAPAAEGRGQGGRTTEVVDNPYGLEALWKGGDMVAKITLAILVIMSMGSWYIIITKVYEQYKMGAQARAAEKTFWKAPSVQQGADGPEEEQPVPLHRRIRARGDEQARRACSATST